MLECRETKHSSFLWSFSQHHTATAVLKSTGNLWKSLFYGMTWHGGLMRGLWAPGVTSLARADGFSKLCWHQWLSVLRSIRKEIGGNSCVAQL